MKVRSTANYSQWLGGALVKSGEVAEVPVSVGELLIGSGKAERVVEIPHPAVPVREDNGEVS